VCRAVSRGTKGGLIAVISTGLLWNVCRDKGGILPDGLKSKLGTGLEIAFNIGIDIDVVARGNGGSEQSRSIAWWVAGHLSDPQT
jgi:hypothetical protein